MTHRTFREELDHQIETNGIKVKSSFDLYKAHMRDLTAAHDMYLNSLDALRKELESEGGE